MAIGSESVMVELPALEASHPLHEVHSKLTEALKLQERYPVCQGDNLTPGLLEALRVRALSEKDAYFCQPGHGESREISWRLGELSPQNEREMLDLLKKLLREQHSAKDSMCRDEIERAWRAVEKACLSFCSKSQTLSPIQSMEDEEFVKYRAWLQENSISDCVGLGYFQQSDSKESKERGVMAIRDIEADEIVYNIPVDHLLCVDTALKSEIGSKFLHLFGVGRRDVDSVAQEKLSWMSAKT
eukprot:759969-Hanusia_phi.AAC.5